MAREKVFRFKQFSVRNDKSAMKVGTDGVLLGAWADVKAANSVLDIGTGTGLVALMMAQRCNANIDAIEIDADAFAEATLNFNESPWAERMKVIHDDFITFSKDCDLRYDVIVSNPPYFIDSLVCQEEKRKNARHTSSLSYENLIECAVKLLNDNGFICLITPSDVENHLDNIIMMNNCYDLTDMDGKGIGHASQEIVQHGTLTMYLAQMHGDGLRLEQTHEDGQATSALFLAQQGDIELIVRCLLQ